MVSITRHHLIIGRFSLFRAAEPKPWSTWVHRVQGRLAGVEIQLLGAVVYVPLIRKGTDLDLRHSA